MSVLLSPYQRFLSLAYESKFDAKAFQRIEREFRNESRRSPEPVGHCAVLSRPLQTCHGAVVVVGGEKGLLTPLETRQLSRRRDVAIQESYNIPRR
jgi:hypothetical protein